MIALELLHTAATMAGDALLVVAILLLVAVVTGYLPRPRRGGELAGGGQLLLQPTPRSIEERPARLHIVVEAPSNVVEFRRRAP